MTDEEQSENRKYSNFVYEMCCEAIRSNPILQKQIDIDKFRPHNTIVTNNIKKSLSECLHNSDAFVVLLDMYKEGFNPNVWFELGVISASDKPVVLIAKETTNIPFDVADINVVKISAWLMTRVDLTKYQSIDKKTYKSMNNKDDISDGTSDFVVSFAEHLLKALELGNPFSSWYDHVLTERLGYRSLIEMFNQSAIIELIRNPDVRAVYISSEREAFKELTREVNNAKQSLRTTRFANQSIVSGKRENAAVQSEFMEALYAASKRNLKICDRIICNNEPMKWNDISEVLINSDSKMRVFVRQKMYSIGFELVIVDEKVAFIHFYQTDNHGDVDENGNPYEHDIEVINSTLKIRGESVCKKLAEIFDRLHHRDFDAGCTDPSRTLLGIPKADDLTSDEQKRGMFQLDSSHSVPSNNRQHQRNEEERVFDIFKNVLKNWKFENPDDKRIMAVGMCLLRTNFMSELNEFFSDSNTIEAIKAEVSDRKKKISEV